MGYRGIVRAKIKEHPSYKVRESKGDLYVELTVDSSQLTVFVDDECIGPDTASRKETLNRAQWIIVRESIWTALVQSHSGTRSGDLALYKKLGKHIVQTIPGAAISININKIVDKIVPGETYLLMPFTTYPENKYYSQNIRFVYLKEPAIRYVYIVPPQITDADQLNASGEALHMYGQYADVNVGLHLIPDPRKRMLQSEPYTLDVEVYYKGGEKPVYKNKISLLDTNEFQYNRIVPVNIYIDPAWRDLGGVHNQKHTPQQYFIKISAIRGKSLAETGKNVNTRPIQIRKPIGIKDDPPSSANIEFDTDKDFKQWYTFDSETNSWVTISMQASINVWWDTMEMILTKFEEDKANQIQYIGDIPYSEREYDQCGYSKIIVKEEDDPNRKALTIFDEDRLKTKQSSLADGDRTTQTFDIVSGEKRKKVSITIEKLQNKNVLCTGVLLPSGEKHNVPENVFLLHRILIPQKNKDGSYAKREDKKEKEDDDVYTDESKAPSSDISIVQHWEQGADYEIQGDNKLLLKLRYLYNKVLTIKNDEYNPNIVGDLFKYSWLLNYLWLTKNDQIYFVPVSTCRYPNQLARIRVFPDIKWTLLFKFNFKEEDFTGFKKENNYELQGFYASETTSYVNNAQTRTTVAGLTIVKTKTQVPIQKKGGIKGLLEIVKRIEVTLIAEWTDENGKKEKKDIIDGFVKQIYHFVAKIWSIAKIVSDFTEGEANDEDRSNKKQLDEEIKKMKGDRSLKGLMDAITKPAKQTEILYPSVAASLVWYYENADDPKKTELDGQKALQINVKIKADPIIGIEIKWDFLEMLCRRHPIAFLVKKIVDGLAYLADPKNKIEVTFTVTGQLAFEANFNHNLAAGNSYSRGYSAKKEELISADATVEAKLQGTIVLYVKTYFIVSELNVGAEATLGIKASIGNKAYFGADDKGLYISGQTHFDGLTFYLEAQAKFEVTFFGLKVWDANPKYEPEPYTCGKFQVDWIKIYFNNPQQHVEFFDTKK